MRLVKYLLLSFMAMSFSLPVLARGDLVRQLPLKTKRVQTLAGMRVLGRTCRLYLSPSKRSKAVIKAPKGRSIWVEPFDMHWSLAFRKSGKSVFVPNNCLISQRRMASL